MLSVALLSIGIAVVCASCEKEEDEVIITTEQLAAPQNIRLDAQQRTLTWDNVPNATSYSVKKGLLDLFPEITTTASYYLDDNYIDSWQTFYIYANGSTEGMTIYLESDMSEYTFVCPVNKSLLTAPDASSIRYIVEERLSENKARISLRWNAVEHAEKYYYSFSHSTSTGNGIISGNVTGNTPDTCSSTLSVNIDSLYYFSVSALPGENSPYINSATTTVRVIVGNE